MHLTQGLRRCVERRRDELALVFGQQKISWEQFETRVAKLAGGLRDLGLQPGDRVAMLAHNCPEYFEFNYGVLWAGGAIVPLNNKLPPDQLAYILDHSQTRFLIADEEFRSVIEGFLGKTSSLEQVIYFSSTSALELNKQVKVEAVKNISYEDLLGNANPLEDQLRGYEDMAGIFYTSGTTGTPKGVVLSHRNLVWNSMGGMLNTDLDEGTVYLHATPLFHAAGSARIFTMISAGATNIILPKFDVISVLAAIERYQVTSLLLVPTMIVRLVNEAKFDAYDLSHLRSIAYGASSMPQAALAEVLKKLPHVSFTQAYGMTELSPSATFLESRYHVLEGPDAGRLLSCGRATWGADVRIVNEQREVLSAGEVGEISVRGPMVMQGYWRNPEATAETIKDGWLHTGDAGYKDAEGFIYIVDRIKDMVITGGVNVASVEVENCIYQLGEVAECAVFGIPHPDWIEAVHAVVVLKENSACTESQIIAHCKNHLGVYKSPRSVEIREQALPVSGTGKIMKNELRKNYL